MIHFTKKKQPYLTHRQKKNDKPLKSISDDCPTLKRSTEGHPTPGATDRSIPKSLNIKTYLSEFQST